ncbi:hypothetical protein PPACK8108_LOCUS14355 [Phakopsora pachyrhizi]|uniref:Uncharacterized protein n=1 Tax=Phakopsora pachyrhizi TaxID=170000 RepID=A0AAV0B727_PHAPC|nr:hypothetical protein PPACK8108_LOCUS14355 [Phakopsora pachyrhizi]
MVNGGFGHSDKRVKRLQATYWKAPMRGTRMNSDSSFDSTTEQKGEDEKEVAYLGHHHHKRYYPLDQQEPARQRPPQSNAAITKKANWITVVIKTKCNKNFAGLLQRTGEKDSLAIAMVGWMKIGDVELSYVKLVTNDLSHNWIFGFEYQGERDWELLQHVRFQEDWMGQDSIADDTPMKIYMRYEVKTKRKGQKEELAKVVGDVSNSDQSVELLIDAWKMRDGRLTTDQLHQPQADGVNGCSCIELKSRPIDKADKFKRLPIRVWIGLMAVGNEELKLAQSEDWSATQDRGAENSGVRIKE